MRYENRSHNTRPHITQISIITFTNELAKKKIRLYMYRNTSNDFVKPIRDMSERMVKLSRIAAFAPCQFNLNIFCIY